MKRDKVWLFRALYFLIFIAVFGDFIANEKPIVCKIKDAWYTPVLRQYAVDLGLDAWEANFVNTPWQAQDYQFKILPPVPYSYYTQDAKNTRYVGPFEAQDVSNWRYRHWLGTDKLGRDVLAGMIAGTRTALLVGMIAMGIASLIGIFLGAMAGYFGDDRLRITWVQLFFGLFGLALGIFWAFIAQAYLFQTNFLLQLSKSFGILLITTLVFSLIGGLLSRLAFLKSSLFFPMDSIVMRLIEVLRSIPGILILLAVLSLIKVPSVLYVMLIIGFLSWTGIARFIRSELLRIRQLEYIDAARAAGFNEMRILLRHAIPNALPPVLITIAFGIAAAILVEASLSFLGIGVSPKVVTWGTMLKDAYRQISAWWIGVFPGLAIFFTVTIFNLLGEHLTEKRQ